MSRSKPYTTNQVSWNTILQKNLRIPMNQRDYAWEEPEVKKFLDDIFKIFEENEYVEKMGSIINLNYNNENYIFDGQQRILTTILILNVICCLSEKLKNKIYQLLAVDTELDKLTHEQEKIKVECNVNIIPKIYCINPYDMKGLVHIFNGEIESWVCYLKNKDQIDSFDDLHEFESKSGTVIGCKTDFIRHITNKYSYKEPDFKLTKLYSAFIQIYNYFVLIKYDEQKLINLYKFLLQDVDIQYYDCTDPVYVSRIFDWENNRGKSVETFDIIKNNILVQIPDEKKLEIYDKWGLLKHKQNKHYKDFGEKIFDIAIQLYNNEIYRIINHEILFKHIIDNNTYIEINKFFEIVEKLFEIMTNICEDKFGKLLNSTPRICVKWEAYMYCLLPIFYNKNCIDTKLIRLITRWYFRNLQFKNHNFNNLTYSTEFINITNKLLKNEKYDYYKDFEELFSKNKDDSIKDENYLRTMKTMNFKSTNATHLLLFLETCINTDLQTVSLEYTLEHIVPQKDKSSLTDQSLMDNIGNLTLIEGKNSENGHKGNSSLGSKKYEIKKESYKGSSCMITRNIADNYNTFTENDINTRSCEIVNLLNIHTDY
tara:strand:+ start:100 stop:1893 length:1794 start_codon:yes stop_codon:yes gene_type:complete